MAIAFLNRKPISRYEAPGTTSRRAPPPLPPRWVERERAVEMPPLSHFVFLSLLLHILAISLVGAPTGGAKDGRAIWGSLLVTLAPGRPAAPAAPAVPAPPQGDDALPTPLAFPRLLDRIPLTQPTRDTTPRLVVPPPVEAESRVLPEIVAPPKPVAEIVAPPKPVAEIVPAPPLPAPIDVPRVQIAPVTPQPERPLVEAPRVMTAPVVERAPIEAPRVIVSPAPAAAERPLLEAPRVFAAPAPAPAVEAVAPPRVVEPVSRPVDRALTQEIAPGPAATEHLTPRLDAATKIEREPPLKIDAQAPVSPFRTPAPAAPRADSTADYDPTAPNLDPEALRKRAAGLAREGSGQRAILAFPMPPVPEKKGKIEDILDKARKPDCRTAYQQLGLAAIVPLLANQIGEGSCRW